MREWMEDKKLYLFDLAHGNLENREMVKGFLKHYIVKGKAIADVQQDLHFRTLYGDEYMQSAISALKAAIEAEINNEE